MYCIFCGKQIAKDSIFCCYCGRKLTVIKNNYIYKYKQYYEPKRYILTLNELKLYKILLEIAKEENLILLCQVSLYSIIKVKNNDYKYFNKIRSKSIDFVLARNYDCKIIVCIELDDSTHNLKERIERDNFINDIFNELNINLLRIKSKTVYNKEEIRSKIKKYLSYK